MQEIPKPKRVFLRAQRKYYEVQWEDPITGKTKTATTNETKRAQAWAAAQEIIRQHYETRPLEGCPATWAEVVEAYRRDATTHFKPATHCKFNDAISAIARHIDPKNAQVISTAVVDRFLTNMRARGLSDFTSKHHMGVLSRILKWCLDRQWIKELPVFHTPKKLRPEPRRPPTGEEFERMLAVLPQAIYPKLTKRCLARGETFSPNTKQQACIDTYLTVATGLWWSGLRLGEVLQLHWSEGAFTVFQYEGDPYFFLRIGVKGDKTNKPRILPIAREFNEFLHAIPVEQRTGYVFNPTGPRGRRIGLSHLSKILARTGKLAGVRVANTLSGKPRFGSAHPLRGSFAERLIRSGATELQVMAIMRHETIQTTKRFYAGHDARAMAESVRHLGDTQKPGDSANNVANTHDDDSVRRPHETAQSPRKTNGTART